MPDCLARWKREVKQQAESSSQLLLDLARQVRRRMTDGDAPPSFTKTLWERFDAIPGELTEREIAYATGSLFGAGSDTSSATLMSFMLAMTCFPDVARRAHDELDRIVGRDRMPTWADQPLLPYCCAIITETLRWRPVAVMGGTPHASTRDDYYDGHFIPKGTTVLGNLWAIHHNEKYFLNSHDFVPERYLQPQDGTAPYPHHDGHSAFGWVRCPTACDAKKANQLGHAGRGRDGGYAQANCWPKTRCSCPSHGSCGPSTSPRRVTRPLARRTSTTSLPIQTASTPSRTPSAVWSSRDRTRSGR